MSEVYDVVVIGAGPAGLSVAAEIAYHEMGSVLVIEKFQTHNQTVHVYYPENKRVDAAYSGQQAICAGVLCFRDTTKVNFLSLVDELIRCSDFPILYGTTVDSIQKEAEGFFTISTSDAKTFHSRFVVVAIGRMGKPNRPEYFNQIPVGARKHVHFDLRNLNTSGKKILVVGGGNSAIEFALSLAEKAGVTLSYRGAAFERLNPMNLKLLEEDERLEKLAILRESVIEGIHEKEGKPLVRFTNGEERLFDDVVFGIGGSSPVAFLQGAGIQLTDRGVPKCSPSLETNVDGLYVAGELSVPPGKGSIIVSFNSGKRIVEHMMNRLQLPRKPELVYLS